MSYSAGDQAGGPAPSLAAGSIVFIGTLPYPPATGVLTRHQLSDGMMQIALTQRGQIICTLHRSNTVIDSAECRIAYRQGIATVIVTWSKAKIESVMSNGEFVFGAKPREVAVSRQALPIERKVFDRQSAERRHRRRQLLERRVADDARSDGGESYAFDALAGEIEQISDLLDLALGGAVSHAPGLMSRVRLCLVGNNPLGLLQLCAAYLDAELTVFTSNDPKAKLPLYPSAAFKIAVSVEPTPILRNGVDLDVWLGFPALILGGQTHSSYDLIREIGNTVGSHLDIDVKPSVTFLREGSVVDGIELTYLNLFVIKVAQVVLALARTLIQQRSDRS